MSDVEEQKATKPKASSRMGKNKKPVPGERQSSESPMKGTDSLKNLQSRSKQKKQAKVEGETAEEKEPLSGPEDEKNDAPQVKSKGEDSQNKAKESSPVKKRATKRDKKGDGQFNSQGLAQDFQSFDILWFDLTTKTRALVSELCQPLVDKVSNHKDLIGQLIKQGDEQVVKVDELERTVFNTGERLTVFEEIYQKIAQVESDRKVVEQRIENNHELILRNFEEHNFKFENNEKQVKTMVTATEDALNEMIELKNAIQVQNKAFMANLEEINKNLVEDNKELREKQSELWNFLGNVNIKTQNQKGDIDQLFSRMDAAEEKIKMLERAKIELFQSKTDVTTFEMNVKRIDEKLNALDENVNQTENHCVKLDNYLVKYQPVRLQSMISETLEACLTGVERRNHELYAQDKIGLLYSIVLQDEGEQTGILKMIIQLNEKAKHYIDEEEKRKRRKNNVPNDKPVDTDSEVGDDNETVQKDGEPNIMSQHDSSIQKGSSKVLKSGENTEEPGKAKGKVPRSGIMDDNQVYRLVDLVNSDFVMSTKDSDYKLNQDQLIKVCKILLHKINHNNLKQDQERELLQTSLLQNCKATEVACKSSMEEVNQFLHNVHQDLENFLRKHKKEHNELNLKIQKLSEVGHKTLDNIDQIKNSIEGYATILTCMLEFNSIEQALTYQEEQDRARQSLLGGSAQKAGKDDFKAAGKSLGSLGPKSSKNQHGSNFFPTYQTIDPDRGLAADDSILQEQASLDRLSTQKRGKDGQLSIDTASKLHSGGQMNALKLAYNPSRVNYRQAIIQRTQLMEMRKTLLDKCEEVVDTLQWPFTNNNLSTSKIFNDLVQFHSDQNNINPSLIEESGSASKVTLKNRKASSQFAKGKIGNPKSSIATAFTGMTSKRNNLLQTQAFNFKAAKNSMMFNHSQGMSNISQSIMSPGKSSHIAPPQQVFAGHQTLTNYNPNSTQMWPQQTNNLMGPLQGISQSKQHISEVGAQSSQDSKKAIDDANLKLPNIQ